MVELYEMDFVDFQQAFILEIVTLDQFISVLNDNFGHIKTKAILRKNLKLARKQEGADRRQAKLASAHQ